MKQAKKIKAKEPVRLRFKKLANGTGCFVANSLT